MNKWNDLQDLKLNDDEFMLKKRENTNEKLESNDECNQFNYTLCSERESRIAKTIDMNQT